MEFNKPEMEIIHFESTDLVAASSVICVRLACTLECVDVSKCPTDGNNCPNFSPIDLP